MSQDDGRSSHRNSPSTGRWTLGKVVQAAVALVAGGAILVWTYRLVIWESHHPAARPARALRHRDPARRLAAVQDLEQFGLEDEAIALEALIGGLDDQTGEVRAAAAKALATILSRTAGKGADSKANRTAIVTLAGLLRDREPNVRVAAADSLASLPWAAHPAMRSERSAETPQTVTTVTLPVGPQEAVDALVETLTDQDSEVRAAAVRALGVIGPQVPYYDRNALNAALNNHSGGQQKNEVAAQAANRSSVDRIVPTLFQLLEHDGPEVREACSGTVRGLGPPAVTATAVPGLIAAVASANREVRFQAAAMLGRLKADARPAIAALMAVLHDSVETQRSQSDKRLPNGDPGCAAATALGEIAPGSDSASQSITALAELARTGNPARRTAAVAGLAGFGSNPTAIAGIAQGLSDRDPAVRLAAIAALTRVGDAHTRVGEQLMIAPPEGLVAALTDIEPTNRRAAAEALFRFERKIGPFIPRLLTALEHAGDDRVKETIARVLELLDADTISPASLPALMISLESQDRLVRLEATGLVGKLGPRAREAIPRLIKAALLESDDPDAAIWNLSASRALGQVAAGTAASQDAISTLVRVLQSKHLHRQVQAALGLAEFGQAAEVAIPDLIRLLKETGGHIDASQWYAATTALLRIAPGTKSADLALSALAETLSSAQNRRLALRDIYDGLWRFGPSEQVVSVLSGALEPGDRRGTEGAIRSLEKLGPAARSAVPKLRALREENDQSIRQAADKALAAIDHE
jgi:HEAT repeat protein